MPGTFLADMHLPPWRRRRRRRQLRKSRGSQAIAPSSAPASRWAGSDARCPGSVFLSAERWNRRSTIDF